jgi:hypothetical protein
MIKAYSLGGFSMRYVFGFTLAATGVDTTQGQVDDLEYQKKATSIRKANELEKRMNNPARITYWIRPVPAPNATPENETPNP